MKNIILLLFILIAVNMFSENKVSIKLQQEKVEVGMNLMSKQVGIEFVYNPQLINTKHLVSANIVDEGIDKAIAILLNDVYAYTRKGKYIIIISEKNVIRKQDDREDITEKIKNNVKRDSGTDAGSCLSISGQKKPILEKFELVRAPQITNNKKDTIMLKKVASLIALSTLTIMPIDAQTDDPNITAPVKEVFNSNLDKSPVQISFLYPLSTDGANSKNKEYKLSLNMLGGVTGGVNGAEFAGLFNINKQDVHGLQMAGIFNLTEGTNKGLQMGGIFNSAKISRGAQLAGVFNHAQESSTIQIAGVGNFAQGTSKLQIAGVMNYASNVGTQISVVNIAKKSSFQLGIVNISDTDDATMLGLFNFVKKGGLFEIGASSNDYIYGAANLVTGTDRLYSIISFGIAPSSVSVENGKVNLSLGAGFGTRIQMGSSQSGIHLELMHNHLYKKNFKDMDDSASLEQFKVLYSLRKNKFTFYGGPAFNVLLRDVGFEKAKKPLYSIFDRKGSKHNVDGWIGAEIGVRFNLK